MFVALIFVALISDAVIIDALISVRLFIYRCVVRSSDLDNWLWWNIERKRFAVHGPAEGAYNQLCRSAGYDRQRCVDGSHLEYKQCELCQYQRHRHGIGQWIADGHSHSDDNLYGDGNWSGGDDCVFNGGDRSRLRSKSSAHGFLQRPAHKHCGRGVGGFELDYKQCDLGEHRRGGIIWGEWIGDGYTERHNHLHGEGAGSGRDGYCVYQRYRNDDDRSSSVRARVSVNGGKSQLLERNWPIFILIYALPEQPGCAVRAGNSLLR